MRHSILHLIECFLVDYGRLKAVIDFSLIVGFANVGVVFEHANHRHNAEFLVSESPAGLCWPRGRPVSGGIDRLRDL